MRSLKFLGSFLTLLIVGAITVFATSKERKVEAFLKDGEVWTRSESDQLPVRLSDTGGKITFFRYSVSPNEKALTIWKVTDIPNCKPSKEDDEASERCEDVSLVIYDLTSRQLKKEIKSPIEGWEISADGGWIGDDEYFFYTHGGGGIADEYRYTILKDLLEKYDRETGNRLK